MHRLIHLSIILKHLKIKIPSFALYEAVSFDLFKLFAIKRLHTHDKRTFSYGPD